MSAARRGAGRSGERLALVRDGMTTTSSTPVAGGAAPMILRLVVTRRQETIPPSMSAAPRRTHPHLRAI